jgi:hypothetical protein
MQQVLCYIGLRRIVLAAFYAIGKDHALSDEPLFVVCDSPMAQIVEHFLHVPNSQPISKRQVEAHSLLIEGVGQLSTAPSTIFKLELVTIRSILTFAPVRTIVEGQTHVLYVLKPLQQSDTGRAGETDRDLPSPTSHSLLPSSSPSTPVVRRSPSPQPKSCCDIIPVERSLERTAYSLSGYHESKKPLQIQMIQELDSLHDLKAIARLRLVNPSDQLVENLATMLFEEVSVSDGKATGCTVSYLDRVFFCSTLRCDIRPEPPFRLFGPGDQELLDSIAKGEQIGTCSQPCGSAPLMLRGSCRLLLDQPPSFKDDPGRPDARQVRNRTDSHGSATDPWFCCTPTAARKALWPDPPLRRLRLGRPSAVGHPSCQQQLPRYADQEHARVACREAGPRRQDCDRPAEEAVRVAALRPAPADDRGLSSPSPRR